MNTEIFSVFDQAALRFIDPFTGPTIEFAIRGFKEACMTEDHGFRKFPEDYILYHVGTFNGESGLIEPLEPRKIAMAISFVGHGVQLELEDQIKREEQA